MSNFSFIIAGLGNPGSEYEKTRHNFGFLAIDWITNNSNSSPTLIANKKNFTLWSSSLFDSSNTSLLIKPLTYMNKSGEAIAEVMRFYKMTPDKLIVLHDELDLPLGALRYKFGGGNAGHNGLKSIQQLLGTPDFHRIRLGIGKPAGYDTSSFVLGRFSNLEQDKIELSFPVINQAIKLIFGSKINEAKELCSKFSTSTLNNNHDKPVR